MTLLTALLSECHEVISYHIYLRCKLGLPATHINNVIFSTLEETKEFVNNILLSALEGTMIIKKQFISLFLYTNDIRYRKLAQRILSMNRIRFNIFLVAIHVLFIIDNINMERSGQFYEYIVNTIEHLLNVTNTEEILMTVNCVTSYTRRGMLMILNDFHHFFDLFIN